MKTSMKLTAGLLLAAGALFASAPCALAGEGGAAGSVSFLVNPYTNAPGSLSSAISVGKATAATIARTTESNAFASAIGGGGVVSITAPGAAAGSTSGLSLAIETGTNAQNQVNLLTSNKATISGNGSVITTAIP